jgi:hypothetical protein
MIWKETDKKIVSGKYEQADLKAEELFFINT